MEPLEIEGAATFTPNVPASSSSSTSKQRWRILCTACYCVSFIGLGMASSLLGPTLPPLADRLWLDGPTKLGPMFIARGVGYFVGTLVMGTLTDRYRTKSHWMLGGCSIVFGVATAAVPFAPSLGALVVIVGVMFTAGGAVDVGGNVLIVHVWGMHKGAGSAMNLLHAAWGAGSSLSPLIARLIGLQAASLPLVYGAIGAFALVTGVCPLLATPPRVIANAEEENASKDGVRNAKVPCTRFVVGIIALFCYYFAYTGCEKLPGDWIETVAVHPARQGGIGATKHEGAMATSAFWGCLLLGRLLSVPLALWITTEQLVAVQFTIAAAAAGLLVTYGQRSLVGLFVAVAGLGLGLAPLYPSGILIARKKLRVSSAWISRFIVGGLVGSALLPALAGATMEKNVAAFGYMEATCVLLCIVCFTIVATMPSPGAMVVVEIVSTAAAQHVVEVEEGGEDGGRREEAVTLTTNEHV